MACYVTSCSGGVFKKREGKFFVVVAAVVVVVVVVVVAAVAVVVVVSLCPDLPERTSEHTAQASSSRACHSSESLTNPSL